MNRFWGYVIAIVTATLNWLVFCWVANYLGAKNPVFLGTALILTVIVHEVGHMIAMEANGIKSYAIFLFIMGGASPLPRYTNKVKELHWSKYAAISLAGVMGNMAMVIMAGLFYLVSGIPAHQLSQIVSLNGLLILYNMWPIWIFDGGHFAKKLFNSMPEHEDLGSALRTGIVIATLALMATILSLRDFLTSGLVIFWGLHFQATHDDPNGSDDPRAMNKKQRSFWSAIYMLIICIAIIMMAVSTQPWYK